MEERESPLKLRKAKFLARVIITLILLGIIVWHLGGIEEIGGLMRRLDPWYCILILLVNTADRILMTFKWARLLRGRGVHLPLFHGMRIYCSSMVWGMFLPATMGADVIRAVNTSSIGLSSHEVVASIVIERMFGALASLLFGLLSLGLLSFVSTVDAHFDSIWWFGNAALLGAAFLLVASFSQRAFDLTHNQLLSRFRDNRVMQKLRLFHSTYRAYQDNKRSLATFFGLTLIEQLGPIFHMWLVARGLGVDVGFLYIAGSVPLAMLISRIPISIGGLGVFDGVFTLLMSLAGVPTTEAIGICLVGRILETVSWLPWWFVDVVRQRRASAPSALAEKS